MPINIQFCIVRTHDAIIPTRACQITDKSMVAAAFRNSEELILFNSIYFIEQTLDVTIIWVLYKIVLVQ